MDNLASFLMHRVDAARKRMWVPARAAEASGALFLAKRCHEAVKAGIGLAEALDRIEEEVVASLGDEAGVGAVAEAAVIRRRLEGPS